MWDRHHAQNSFQSLDCVVPAAWIFQKKEPKLLHFGLSLVHWVVRRNLFRKGPVSLLARLVCEEANVEDYNLRQESTLGTERDHCRPVRRAYRVTVVFLGVFNVIYVRLGARASTFFS